MSDGTLSVNGWGFWWNRETPIQNLYICQACSALVFDMTTHANWHEDQEEHDAR